MNERENFTNDWVAPVFLWILTHFDRDRGNRDDKSDKLRRETLRMISSIGPVKPRILTICTYEFEQISKFSELVSVIGADHFISCCSFYIQNEIWSFRNPLILNRKIFERERISEWILICFSLYRTQYLHRVQWADLKLAPNHIYEVYHITNAWTQMPYALILW